VSPTRKGCQAVRFQLLYRVNRIDCEQCSGRILRAGAAKASFSCRCGPDTPRRGLARRRSVSCLENDDRRIEIALAELPRMAGHSWPVARGGGADATFTGSSDLVRDATRTGHDRNAWGVGFMGRLPERDSDPNNQYGCCIRLRA